MITLQGSESLRTHRPIPELAASALRMEIDLTPKPGLVDRLGNGAHKDMDYPLFLASIAAIAPWFPCFYELGIDTAEQAPASLLAALRDAGMACEQAMFAATSGVNTHKGGIFSLGLLCGVAGRLQAQGERLTRERLCQEVALLCQGMVERELARGARGRTAGEQLYLRFGLTGARGEVQSGFATVRRHLLPHWPASGHADEQHLLQALLRLMAVNPDTNLVSRGGMAGLHYVQHYARQLLRNGWHHGDLVEMDRQLIARNLSPGGSADLLAVAWLLAALPSQDLRPMLQVRPPATHQPVVSP